LEGSIRVLICDDSFFVRSVLRRMLTEAPGYTVVGTAQNGLEAVTKARELRPDVITMDVEMPVMNGLQALEKIMSEYPTPVVMVSSLTERDAEVTLQALATGAVDFVQKPGQHGGLGIGQLREEIITKLQTAAMVDPVSLRSMVVAERQIRVSAVDGPRTKVISSHPGAEFPLVVIGSSTGGPSALSQLLPQLPADLGAAVIVVQHMPAGFTRSLADRLSRLSHLSVKEASDDQLVKIDRVLVAPGGKHLLIKGNRVKLTEDAAIHGVRPAVDATLLSAVNSYGAQRIISVIMTGMGSDGSMGTQAVVGGGGWSLAQSRATCVVYGMPRVLVERGLARQVADLHEMPGLIVDAVTRWYQSSLS